MKTKHKNIDFRYTNAGDSGIDIKGYIGNDLSLIAEVKTNIISITSLRGPQKNQIEKDLKRLSNEHPKLQKYLIVLSEKTKTAIERQLKTNLVYPNIQILNPVKDFIKE